MKVDYVLNAFHSFLFYLSLGYFGLTPDSLGGPFS